MLPLIVFVADAVLLCILINLVMQLRYQAGNPDADIAGQRRDTRKRTEKMALTAMMLAFALALKYFSVSLPLMGSNGLRIGFGGIFTAFPAILFGPVYGGVTSALSDLLGFFMKPSGDYNFLFTLMAFVGGFLKGVLWLLLKKAGKRAAVAGKSILAAFLCVFAAFGLSVIISLNADNIMKGPVAVAADVPAKAEMTEMLDGGDAGLPTRFVGMLTSTKSEKSYQKNFATYANLSGLGLVITGFAGLLGIAVETSVAAYRRKKGKNPIVPDVFPKILICVLIPGVIVTTVNSPIIMSLYGIKAPFLIYWLPRLAEEIIVCAIQAYIISVIYIAAEKLFRSKGYV